LLKAPAGGGWDKITFDDPYVWDGSSNLVIEIIQDDVFTGTNTLVERQIGSTKKSLAYFQSTSGAGSATSGTSTTIWPMMKLNYCSAAAIPNDIGFTWSPTSMLDDPNASTTLAYPSFTTTYVVTIADSTDANACTTSDFVAVYDSCGLILNSELLSFHGKHINDHNTLQWHAASEAKLFKYILEGSLNHVDFEAVGERSSEGNNNSYIFLDTDLTSYEVGVEGLAIADCKLDTPLKLEAGVQEYV